MTGADSRAPHRFRSLRNSNLPPHPTSLATRWVVGSETKCEEMQVCMGRTAVDSVRDYAAPTLCCFVPIFRLSAFLLCAHWQPEKQSAARFCVNCFQPSGSSVFCWQLTVINMCDFNSSHTFSSRAVEIINFICWMSGKLLLWRRIYS